MCLSVSRPMRGENSFSPVPILTRFYTSWSRDCGGRGGEGGGNTVGIRLRLKSPVPLGLSGPVAWGCHRWWSPLHLHCCQAQHRRQTSLAVAVDSILSIVTGSTSRSFRKTCLQALQVRGALGVHGFSDLLPLSDMCGASGEVTE